MEEIWRPVEGFENYEVSNLGRVVGKKRGMILKSALNRDGYPSVVLCKEGVMTTKTVHRLVGIAFIPNPENKRTIDHINRDKTDNKVSNLRWYSDTEQSYNRKERIDSVKHKNIYGRRVRIRREGKIIFSKSFDTVEEAIKARDSLLQINLTSEDSSL